MSEPTDADTIARLRAAFTKIARRIDRQVSGGGLTSTQLAVLATVAVYGPIGLSKLADIEGINPTMLSRIVGGLEDAGLIARHVDPDDRRVSRVEVTAAGARLRSKMQAKRTKVLSERLALLPADQVAALVGALPALEALVVELGSSTVVGTK